MNFLRIHSLFKSVKRLDLFSVCKTQHGFFSTSSYRSSLKGKDLLCLKDLNSSEIQTLISTANNLKQRFRDPTHLFAPLAGKSIGMIFEKRSTRTRVSIETGIALLGGHAVFLSPNDIHMGVSESPEDTARVLSQMCNLIVARVKSQSTLERLASTASVPVISGLSDLYHPLQTLADCLTMQEHFGSVQGLTLGWVGDGSNILHSLMMGCPALGININIASPKGYEPHPTVLADSKKLCQKFSTSLNLFTDPRDAVKDANIVSTDVWVSMGQEQEREERMEKFKGYQVSQEMMKEASEDCIFLHCLPRTSLEVSDEVFYGKQSLVWQQAGNRKWTVMAVMLHLLNGAYEPAQL